MNEAGVCRRQGLEDRLDELAAAPWQLLGCERTTALIDLVVPVAHRLLGSVDATAGPNWMPAVCLRRAPAARPVVLG